MEIQRDTLKENKEMFGSTISNNKVGIINDVVSKEIGITHVKSKIGKKKKSN